MERKLKRKTNENVFFFFEFFFRKAKSWQKQMSSGSESEGGRRAYLTYRQTVPILIDWFLKSHTQLKFLQFTSFFLTFLSFLLVSHIDDDASRVWQRKRQEKGPRRQTNEYSKTMLLYLFFFFPSSDFSENLRWRLWRHRNWLVLFVWDL